MIWGYDELRVIVTSDLEHGFCEAIPISVPNFSGFFQIEHLLCIVRPLCVSPSDKIVTSEAGTLPS